MAKRKVPKSGRATRYIAFLRAVNVGGRVVKMDELKAILEGIGLANVETFIASGNAIFTSNAEKRALALRIEEALEDALGYEVTTMLRTDGELAASAAAVPFSDAERASAHAVHVGFLRAPLDLPAVAMLPTCSTAVDDFKLVGTELYWLLRVPQNESKFVLTSFEKKFGCRATFRNLNTVEKLVAKYPPES